MKRSVVVLVVLAALAIMAVFVTACGHEGLAGTWSVDYGSGSDPGSADYGSSNDWVFWYFKSEGNGSYVALDEGTKLRYQLTKSSAREYDGVGIIVTIDDKNDGSITIDGSTYQMARN